MKLPSPLAVRTYRAGECSAEDLLSTMWSMFDSRLSAMTEIVTELAEILDMPDKARTLLQAWESFNVSVRFFLIWSSLYSFRSQACS